MQQMQKFKNWKKNLFRGLAGIFCACFCTVGAAGYYADTLPDHYYLNADQPLSISAALPVTVSLKEDTIPRIRQARLKLFGMIPVKTVSLTPMEPMEVYVGGEPFGIRMLMAGVMVISLSDVTTRSGICCPAKDAGICVGDMIQAVDGKTVSCNADLQEAVAASQGKSVRVTFLRDGLRQTVAVQPARSMVHNCFQTGMWVRDSTAGIGTITYYLPAENGAYRFAGLGHAVCDPDTGEQVPLASGDVLRAAVTDVLAGAAGRPGELRGRFDTENAIGTLLSNNTGGVFGILNALPSSASVRMPLGLQQDIRLGEAEIYTTLMGTEPQRYTVEIEALHGGGADTCNLVIHVTDEALLAQSGGIVQGMSGSPIIQDGKLIGAVTHVFLKDPTRGYGILAENMYAQTVAELAEAG